MGLEPEILDGTGGRDGPEGMKKSSFLQEAANPGFLASIQRVNDRAESTPHRLASRDLALPRLDRGYSAAATNAGFLLATESMKSEMRGTISDLKREPLKTP